MVRGSSGSSRGIGGIKGVKRWKLATGGCLCKSATLSRYNSIGNSVPSREDGPMYRWIGSIASPRGGRSSSHGTLDTSITDSGIPAYISISLIPYHSHQSEPGPTSSARRVMTAHPDPITLGNLSAFVITMDIACLPHSSSFSFPFPFPFTLVLPVPTLFRVRTNPSRLSTSPASLLSPSSREIIADHRILGVWHSIASTLACEALGGKSSEVVGW